MPKSKPLIVEFLLLGGYYLTWPLHRVISGALYLASSASVFTSVERKQTRNASDAARARALIGNHVEKYEEQLKHCKADEEEQMGRVKKLMRQGKRKEAVNALRKCKTLQSRCKGIENALRAAETQLEQLEQTAMVQGIVASQREVNKALSGTNMRKLNDETADAVDELESSQQELAEIQAVLGDWDLGADLSEDALLEELNSLEEEELDMQLRDLKPGTGSVNNSDEDVHIATDPVSVQQAEKTAGETQAAWRDIELGCEEPEPEANENVALLSAQ